MQHAAVFCVDEKSAIQALDRLDPVLPLSPGRPNFRNLFMGERTITENKSCLEGWNHSSWHLHANRQEPPRLECIREYHGPSCPARASDQAWEVPSGSPLHGRARPGQSPMPRSRQPDLFLYAFVSSRVGVEVRARGCDWQYESSSFIQPDLQGSESLSRARVTRSNSPAKYFCTASLKI